MTGAGWGRERGLSEAQPEPQSQDTGCRSQERRRRADCSSSWLESVLAPKAML